MTRARRFATRFGLAIGIWTLAFMAGVVLQGCTAGGPTAPDPVSQQAPAPVAAAPAPAPTATPTAVADPTSPTSFEGRILPNGGWTVKNTATTPSRFTAYYTSFDNQSLPLGSKPPVIRNPGDTYEDTFNLQCVQVDLTYGNPGDTPFLAGFIAKDGSVFNPSTSPAKVAECRTVPCVEKWIFDDEKFDTTYGEYGACSRPDVTPSDVSSSTQTACSKKRTVTRVYYETSSCTQERRVAKRVVTEESTPCECACVEPKEVREIPSTVYWGDAILEGKCNPEVLPLVGIDEATTTALNCHTSGQQKIILDYQCQADSFRTRDLCKNVACPATCDNTPASYKGNANGGLFNLQNSGDAAELAWVNSNVLVGPWEKFASEGEKDDDCTGADVAAKVVIVKAGSSSSIEYSYKTYLNVTVGQQLCSYDPPGSDKAKDISHVTYFRCD